MKRVLVITYYWPPSGGSGVQRWLKFVKYLPEFGVKPFVLTVDPEKANYPVIDKSLEKEIPQDLIVYKTKTFEIFDIYRKLIGKGKYPHSSFDNETNPSLAQKFSRFIRGNLFIPDARVGWKPYVVKKALEIIAEHNIDTVITTGPPQSVHLSGLELKKRTAVNWIADFRDPWTDIFYYDAFYHTALAKKYDASLERKVIERADRITIVSDALKQLLQKKSKKISQDKIQIIPNGFDEEDFNIPSSPPRDKFLITFTGSLANDANKMDVFVEALYEVMADNPDVPVLFRFVGNIDDSVREVFAKFEIDHILEFIPYVPHEESVKYLMESTACFSTIRRNPKNKGIVSGKIFDYIGSRKPIICIGPEDGNVNDVIKECKAGRVIDYENKSAFKEYLTELFNHWKGNKNLDSRNPVYLKYSRNALANKISGIINDI